MHVGRCGFFYTFVLRKIWHKIMDFGKSLSKTGQSLKSLAKVVLLSRRHSLSRAAEAGSKPLVVMGNGPSLRDAIAEHGEVLMAMPAMAVNFAANAPEFESLHPEYYILADPHFFDNTVDVNVTRLIESLSCKVTWPMRLLVPAGARRKVDEKILVNKNITVETYNAVGAEGWEWLENMLYRRGLAMPRPRNVLIPALMTAMEMGFDRIYVAGADHSWTRTLSVNERNEVVSVQPHFYKEEESEKRRVATEYLRYPLHSILYSFYVAFRSYFTIRRYADGRGVKIYNATPGSFIDAFERRGLETIADNEK